MVLVTGEGATESKRDRPANKGLNAQLLYFIYRGIASFDTNGVEEGIVGWFNG